MPRRIVLLSVVTEQVLVEQCTVEVLDRLNQPDPVLVALTRPLGKTVRLSRAAAALVENAGDLAAETALSTTATSGASAVREEGITPGSPMHGALLHAPAAALSASLAATPTRRGCDGQGSHVPAV